MKTAFILMALLSSASGIVFNFGTQHNTENWRIVNDGVMGGVSTSSLIENDNAILFKGETSLDNNGGFASIRTLIDKGRLKDCKTMTIRFKSSSTHRTFGLSLKTSQRYYIPYHKFTFTPKSTDWEELKINITEFKHYRISEIIGENMPLEVLKEVFNIALIVSDGKAGDFNIEIDYIKFE
ncbi:MULTISPECIES: CIA30 family protein [Hwangdonia]|uniref:CIA30 family protein n=1 Tax=Hwangdonia seohaensis TaxID=1240727 RepID=A0ABW3R7U5_9FLAO|nr:CIA30 family protein [Hwangdonia seohaensis]